jgi:hypothetical protein
MTPRCPRRFSSTPRDKSLYTLRSFQLSPFQPRWAATAFAVYMQTNFVYGGRVSHLYYKEALLFIVTWDLMLEIHVLQSLFSIFGHSKPRYSAVYDLVRLSGMNGVQNNAKMQPRGPNWAPSPGNTGFFWRKKKKNTYHVMKSILTYYSALRKYSKKTRMD